MIEKERKYGFLQGSKSLVRRYEIADIGIYIETQMDYKDTAPYADFLKPVGKCDMRYDFVSGELPSEEGVCVQDKNGVRVYQSEKGQQRFLLEDEKPYACSELPENGTVCQVTLNEQAPKLWDGFVFTALGLEHLLIQCGRVILHASYIEWNGQAILFTAPCQTGKSTQARLWQEYQGAETINGDRVCLSADHDIVLAHGLPMAGTSGICHNKTFPVAAIVYLSQAPENRLERLTGAAAFKKIYSGCWVNDWNRKDTEKAVEIVSRIVMNVQVFHLACRPDKQAVDLLADALGGGSYE